MADAGYWKSCWRRSGAGGLGAVLMDVLMFENQRSFKKNTAG
jgi:hypothetical protein